MLHQSWPPLLPGGAITDSTFLQSLVANTSKFGKTLTHWQQFSHFPACILQGGEWSNNTSLWTGIELTGRARHTQGLPEGTIPNELNPKDTKWSQLPFQFYVDPDPCAHTEKVTKWVSNCLEFRSLWRFFIQGGDQDFAFVSMNIQLIWLNHPQ